VYAVYLCDLPYFLRAAVESSKVTLCIEKAPVIGRESTPAPLDNPVGWL